MSLYCLIHFTAINVKFGTSVYRVKERNKQRYFSLVLMLSNPSSSDVTITVQNTDITATGMNTTTHLIKCL